MKGIKYHLTTNQKYMRNYVFNQARKMVMKQTNGLYPAPLKIMEVGGYMCGCLCRRGLCGVCGRWRVKVREVHNGSPFLAGRAERPGGGTHSWLRGRSSGEEVSSHEDLGYGRFTLH